MTAYESGDAAATGPRLPGWERIAATFLCTVEPDRETARVVPCGELDLATGPIVDRCLAELHGAGFAALQLDLRRLTFIDASGVRLVERWAERARREGVVFTVVPGPPEVQFVFRLTGTEDQLPFCWGALAGARS